jgi:hypothetical protein
MQARPMRRGILLSFLGWLTFLTAGCGAGNEPLPQATINDVKLRDVGELYRVHQINRKVPPKSLKDFAAFGNVTPSAYEAIRGGDVVVRWGATLPDTDEEPSTHSSDEVLAYLKEVPQQGGSVLMLDRSMRTLTADEFKGAKLAGTEPTKP